MAQKKGRFANDDDNKDIKKPISNNKIIFK
jgi:hypothetical protein